MQELISQIRRASDAGLYYLALMGALSLIDICGALESADGEAKKSKFKKWLRANLPTYAARADMLYGLRCSLLHQGRAKPHGSDIPVAFTQPPIEIHDSSFEIVGRAETYWLSVPRFVGEIADAAERWLAKSGNTKIVTQNLERFARLRPDGLPPWVVGVPVIA